MPLPFPGHGARDLPVPDEHLTPRVARAGLAIVLVVAALLRFYALDAGLRETPHVDESYFVGHVARMLHTHSLDHGYYEYPGLMFYLLMPVLALAGVSQPPQPAEYLAARGFVAACGVLAVGLAFVFARRLAGRTAALFTAAALAVSPLHVLTAHRVRPDVVLEVLVLLFLLAVVNVGARPRDDVRAGGALGLALGLKFSAGLLLPVYLMQRGLAAGRRWYGLGLAGLVAVVVFLCVSPYALLHLTDFQQGVHEQLAYHYEVPAWQSPYWERVLTYARVWLRLLSPVGLGLAALGLVLVLRHDARRYLPLLVLPVLTAAVFGSTDLFFERHMLPSSALVALLAGIALARLACRWPGVAAALALVALALSLQASLQELRWLGRPSTRERAARWIESHVPAPARVATDVQGLRLGSGAYELLRLKSDVALARLQVWDARLLVSRTLDAGLATFGLGAPTVHVRPEGPYEGEELWLWPVPERWRRREIALDVHAARLSASALEGLEGLERLRDGRLDTAWSVAARAAPGAWLELAWAQPRWLTSVELVLGTPPEPGSNLRVQVTRDGVHYEPWPWLPARPAPAEQLPALGAPSELLLGEAVEARAVRIERRLGARPWSIAELHVRVRGDNLPQDSVAPPQR